jgi:hypothetical protein
MNAILDIAKLVVVVLNVDGPDENAYGYREKLQDCSNQDLVDMINREVGKPFWVRERGDYLAHLYLEFISRDLDCSSFIRDNFMSIAKPLRLLGKKVEVAI